MSKRQFITLIVWLCIIGCICFGLFAYFPHLPFQAKPPLQSSNQTILSTTPIPTVTPTPLPSISATPIPTIDPVTQMVQDTIQQVGYANFFYPVSQTYRLPQDYPLDTAQLPLGTFEGKQVAQIIIDPLSSMFADARKAGYYPQLVSGFRSINNQQALFNSYVSQEEAAGLSYKDAVTAANQYSAEPGYSEHHLGLAVDIANGDDGFDTITKNYNKGFYEWLREHAYEYGFVLSYPTSATNIQDAKPGSGYNAAEPWHYRYVGKEVAQYLYTNNYLDPTTSLTLNTFLLQVAGAEVNKK